MSARHRTIAGRRWQETRWRVFLRDGYRCKVCHKSGRLECDHVVPLHMNPTQDPYDPAGCQTLCRGCHIAKTRAERQKATPRRELVPGEAAWRRLVAAT